MKLFGGLIPGNIALPFYNTPGDGTGGGGGGQPGAGGDNTNQNPNPAGGGQKPDANGGQPDKGAGGGGGQQPAAFSYKEDRSDWVPRTRLNEVTGKLTKFETENLTLKQQNDLLEKRTRALLGVEPKDEKAEEQEAIKASLLQLFPQLKTLENLSAERLQEILEAAGAAKSTAAAQWERHATSMLSDLESEVAKAVGVDKLSDTQRRSLQRAYREEAAMALQARREGVDFSNDFLARHERGDKTLLAEFAKAFLGDWYEPARRSANTEVARRGLRPVPRGERTRQIPAGGTPANTNLNDPKEFKKALLAARGGGQE